MNDGVNVANRSWSKAGLGFVGVALWCTSPKKCRHRESRHSGGFNGELFIDEADAMRLGFVLREGYSKATLAGGIVHNIRRGTGMIIWLGQPRRVEVLAAVSTAARQPRLPDNLVVLVGTKLLSPHLLLMDFANQTIEIEAQD